MRLGVAASQCQCNDARNEQRPLVFAFTVRLSRACLGKVSGFTLRKNVGADVLFHFAPVGQPQPAQQPQQGRQQPQPVQQFLDSPWMTPEEIATATMRLDICGSCVRRSYVHKRYSPTGDCQELHCLFCFEGGGILSYTI